MELRQLEQFVAVAEECQFTRAAARCKIAQSALSTSIRALERELGAALFLRTTRKVALTEAGHALLTEARHTLAAADVARGVVHDVQAVLRGTLVIGGIPTLDVLDQADLLHRFHAQHPKVEIRYVRANSHTLIEAVREGAINIAFVSVPFPAPVDLRLIELAVEPMMFICRPDHRLADHALVTFAEMAEESFVGGPPGTIAYQTIDRVFAESGIERNVPYEVNDVLSMLDFVAAGLGVTLLIKKLTESRPELRAVPLADTSVVWTLGVVAPAAARATPAATALLDLLLAEDT